MTEHDQTLESDRQWMQQTKDYIDAILAGKIKSSYKTAEPGPIRLRMEAIAAEKAWAHVHQPEIPSGE